jgi:hypothetical protein
MSTPISFDLLQDGGKTDWEASPLIAYASIKSGTCAYEYSDWLAEKLANPDIYTLININVQRQFSGGYALALYENCLRFKRTGSTGWISVETWRRLLGADASMYDEFKHFSSEVIKKAVKEINQVSNIIVTPEYKREARRVVQIRFLVEDNPQRSMLDNEEDEGQKAIRDSDAFKKLTKLGVGDRLAISWIQQEPDRALQTALYVEDRAKRKQIRGNAGGYARTVFEKGARIEIAPTETAPEPKLSTKEVEEGAADERARRTSDKIKALSLKEKQQFAAEYMNEGGKGNTYLHEQGTFKNALERTAYTSWLRAKIAAS